MTVSEEGPTIPRWRWIMHLLVLMAFPFAGYIIEPLVNWIGSLYGTELSTDDPTQPILPKTTFGLIKVTLDQLIVFIIFFGASWLFSRVTFDQLLLRLRNGWITPLLGFGYSIGLRIGIAMALLIFV